MKIIVVLLTEESAERAAVPGVCLPPTLVFHISGVVWKSTPLDHINGEKRWGKEARKGPFSLRS